MKSALTGEAVRALRGALGLNVSQFAQLLGVDVATVFRWQKTGNEPASVEGLQVQLLLLLEQQVLLRGAELAGAIRTQLRLHGSLAGLFCLLNAAYGTTPRTEPQQSVAPAEHFGRAALGSIADADAGDEAI